MCAVRPNRSWTVKVAPDEVAAFAALNGEPLGELRAFTDLAEGFTLALAEVEFRQDAEILWELLRTKPGAEDVQMVGLWLGDPGLQYLKDELVGCLAGVEREPGKRLAIVAGGLEQGIKIQGNLQPLLKDLNFLRDAYGASVPYPLILILPRGAMERLAAFAPDFWAWQSGLFIFQALSGRSAQVRSQLNELSGYTANDSVGVRENRIDLLQRLLSTRSWDGASKKAFRRALVDAYPSYAQLQLFLQEEFGVSLSVVAGEGQLEGAAFELVQWAEVNGRLDELFTDFARGNPRHPFAKREPLAPSERQDLLEKLGVAWYYRGDWTEAESCFREALLLSKQEKNNFSTAFDLGSLGCIARERGNWDEAERLFRQSLELQEELGDRSGMASSWGQLGDIERNRGNWDAAERLYRQSLELREELGDRSSASEVTCDMGTNELQRGNFEEAEIWFTKALKQLEALGKLDYIAECNFRLAQLWQRRNNSERAQRHYAIAHKIYTELGAKKDLERIEREFISDTDP